MFKTVIPLILMLLAAGSMAYGEDAHFWKETNLDDFQGPRHQLSVSAGVRTDETRWVDAQPELSVKYLRWFNRFVAFTTDLGFTNETAFSSSSTARTFAFGAGFRLQEPGELLSAYLEPGLSVHRHTGDLEGRDFSRTRFGVSLTLGLSVRTFGKSSLDISFRQILNAPESRPIYVATPPMPEEPPDDLWRPIGGADPYDLYNTTHVLVSYRFSL